MDLPTDPGPFQRRSAPFRPSRPAATRLDATASATAPAGGNGNERPLIVIMSLSPFDVGGAERNALQVIQGLQGTYRFHVVAPIGPRFAEELSSLPFRVGTTQVPTYGKLNLWAIRRFQFLFRKLGASIVHTHDPRARLLGHLAARRAGIASVHTVHMCPLYYPMGATRRRFYEVVEGWLTRRVSNRTIFVSRNVERLYRERGLAYDGRVGTIHNGVEPNPVRSTASIRSESRVRFGLSSATPLGIVVARLSREKGVADLLDAVQQIYLNTDSVSARPQFLIVGEGPLQGELENRVKSLGLAEVVRFAGFQGPKEIQRLLAASDFFLLPSRFESLPYSVLEALAAGLPCIASAVGGIPELVEDGHNGLLVTPGDVASLKKAIETVAFQPALRARFARNARAHSKSFSIDSMLQKTSDVYASVLPPTPQRGDPRI